MANIILEGHCYYNASIIKKDIYSFYGKDNHHARILIDVKSEIFCTQIQWISNETKSTFWTKDELLFAFNDAYINIKRFVETDGPIKIFDENIFYSESKELKHDELKDDFQIEISEDRGNYKKLNIDLMRLKEAKINFDKCKDKLFQVISWGPNLLNHYHYNINRIIDYLSCMTNAGVVTVSNNEKLGNIKAAFDELRKRKNTQNSTYQTIHNIAQKDIYILEFPKYFKSDLPRNEINQVIDETR